MAEDFASVIYAIETNNQPRSDAIDAGQTGICGGNGHIINGSAVRRMRRAISFPSGARIQHLISVALARISLRIALISPPVWRRFPDFCGFWRQDRLELTTGTGD